ncbi:hypothetical protein GCM10014719_65530 [Planomonospora parontospora subsp. antibiotica]|nr:hypothetical protein GCM10014719_65530 [Planomonospora parontospora subsp. antibiotica]GII19779.1 hypothetical protein Ppa05_65050 [Planomonospora parontospora subsp. antibiotica]
MTAAVTDEDAALAPCFAHVGVVFSGRADLLRPEKTTNPVTGELRAWEKAAVSSEKVSGPEPDEGGGAGR